MRTVGAAPRGEERGLAREVERVRVEDRRQARRRRPLEDRAGVRGRAEPGSDREGVETRDIDLRSRRRRLGAQRVHHPAHGIRREDADETGPRAVRSTGREGGSPRHALGASHHEQPPERALVSRRLSPRKEPRDVGSADGVSGGRAVLLEGQETDGGDADSPAKGRGRKEDVTGLRVSERDGEVGAYGGSPRERLVRREARGHVDRDDERPPFRDEAHGARRKPVRRDGPLQAGAEERVQDERRRPERLEIGLLRHLANRSSRLLEALMGLPGIQTQMLGRSEQQRLHVSADARRLEQARRLETIPSVVARAREDDDACAAGCAAGDDARDLPHERRGGPLHEDEPRRSGRDRPRVQGAGCLRREDLHPALRPSSA